MKFLLVPGNNSLSHVAKALAILVVLTRRGHDARIAVSRRHALFLKKLGYDHYILPDIQESDEAGFPTVNWFNRPQRTVACIKAEVNLLKEFRPHRVLGNVTICDCQPEHILGNLYAQTLSEIWNGEAMANHRQQMLSADPPENCKICPRF